MTQRIESSYRIFTDLSINRGLPQGLPFSVAEKSEITVLFEKNVALPGEVPVWQEVLSGDRPPYIITLNLSATGNAEGAFSGVTISFATAVGGLTDAQLNILRAIVVRNTNFAQDLPFLPETDIADNTLIALNKISRALADNKNRVARAFKINRDAESVLEDFPPFTNNKHHVPILTKQIINGVTTYTTDYSILDDATNPIPNLEEFVRRAEEAELAAKAAIVAAEEAAHIAEDAARRAVEKVGGNSRVENNVYNIENVDITIVKVNDMDMNKKTAEFVFDYEDGLGLAAESGVFNGTYLLRFFRLSFVFSIDSVAPLTKPYYEMWTRDYDVYDRAEQLTLKRSIITPDPNDPLINITTDYSFDLKVNKREIVLPGDPRNPENHDIYLIRHEVDDPLQINTPSLAGEMLFPGIDWSDPALNVPLIFLEDLNSEYTVTVGVKFRHDVVDNTQVPPVTTVIELPILLAKELFTTQQLSNAFDSYFGNDSWRTGGGGSVAPTNPFTESSLTAYLTIRGIEPITVNDGEIPVVKDDTLNSGLAIFEYKTNVEILPTWLQTLATSRTHGNYLQIDASGNIVATADPTQTGIAVTTADMNTAIAGAFTTRGIPAAVGAALQILRMNAGATALEYVDFPASTAAVTLPAWVTAISTVFAATNVAHARKVLSVNIYGTGFDFSAVSTLLPASLRAIVAGVIPANTHQILRVNTAGDGLEYYTLPIAPAGTTYTPPAWVATVTSLMATGNAGKSIKINSSLDGFEAYDIPAAGSGGTTYVPPAWITSLTPRIMLSEAGKFLQVDALGTGINLTTGGGGGGGTTSIQRILADGITLDAATVTNNGPVIVTINNRQRFTMAQAGYINVEVLYRSIVLINDFNLYIGTPSAATIVATGSTLQGSLRTLSYSGYVPAGTAFELHVNLQSSIAVATADVRIEITAFAALGDILPPWANNFTPTIAEDTYLMQITNQGGNAEMDTISRADLWTALTPSYLTSFAPALTDTGKFLSIVDNSGVAEVGLIDLTAVEGNGVQYNIDTVEFELQRESFDSFVAGSSEYNFSYPLGIREFRTQQGAVNLSRPSILRFQAISLQLYLTGFTPGDSSKTSSIGIVGRDIKFLNSIDTIAISGLSNNIPRTVTYRVGTELTAPVAASRNEKGYHERIFTLVAKTVAASTFPGIVTGTTNLKAYADTLDLAFTLSANGAVIPLAREFGEGLLPLPSLGQANYILQTDGADVASWSNHLSLPTLTAHPATNTLAGQAYTYRGSFWFKDPSGVETRLGGSGSLPAWLTSATPNQPSGAAPSRDYLKQVTVGRDGNLLLVKPPAAGASTLTAIDDAFNSRSFIQGRDWREPAVNSAVLWIKMALAAPATSIATYNFNIRDFGREGVGKTVGGIMTHNIDSVVVSINENTGLGSFRVNVRSKNLYDATTTIRVIYPTASGIMSKNITPVKHYYTSRRGAAIQTNVLYAMKLDLFTSLPTAAIWSAAGNLLLKDGLNYKDSLTIGITLVDSDNVNISYVKTVGGVESALEERGLLPASSDTGKLAIVGETTTAELGTTGRALRDARPAKRGLKYFKPSDLGIKSYSKGVIFLDGPKNVYGYPSYLKRNTAVNEKIVISAGVRGRINGTEFLLKTSLNATIQTNRYTGAAWQCTLTMPSTATREDARYLGEEDYAPHGNEIQGRFVVSGMGNSLKAKKGTFQIFSFTNTHGDLAYLKAFVQSELELTKIERQFFHAGGTSDRDDAHELQKASRSVVLTAVEVGYIFVGPHFSTTGTGAFVSYAHPVRSNTAPSSAQRSLGNVWIYPYAGGEITSVWDGTLWVPTDIMEVGQAHFSTATTAVIAYKKFTEPVSSLNTLRFRIQSTTVISLIGPGRIHVGANDFGIDEMSFTIADHGVSTERAFTNITWYGIILRTGLQIMTIARPFWDYIQQSHMDRTTWGRVVFKIHRQANGNFVQQDAGNHNPSVIFNSREKIPTQYSVQVSSGGNLLSSHIPGIVSSRTAVGEYTIVFPVAFFSAAPLVFISSKSSTRRIHSKLVSITSVSCEVQTWYGSGSNWPNEDREFYLIIQPAGRDLAQAELFNRLSG